MSSPLTELRLECFTIFKSVRLKWSPGLNVLIGANGTGKTHLHRNRPTRRLAILNAFKVESHRDKTAPLGCYSHENADFRGHGGRQPMIKRILVPTDGSDCAAIGVRYAAALAREHGGVLVGLHVVDVKLLEGPFLRDISASLGTAPYVNYQGNIALILEERGKAALETFEQICAAAGVACETVQVTGIVPRCILEQSELADLILLGRGGEHSEWLDGLVGSTTAAIARRAKRPVLVTGTDTPGDNGFVVAYDGSVHAKGALQTAANIARDWEMKGCVLVIGDDRTNVLLDEARAYLDAHEISMEYELQSGDPSETIVEFARERHADLLIMGAYGHTKVRELVVGSTTAFALNHAPCPLLLSR